jgi:hypothetical protein
MIMRVLMFVAILLLVCSFANVGSSRQRAKKNIATWYVQEKTILFSGYKWAVRNTSDTQGPGPNYFSDRSVWVDQKGVLHLYLHKDSLSGNWQCAEINSFEKFRYGTYSFVVDGAIDKFDKNIVLGLFNYSGNDGYDEIDIEFGRWGNARYPNLNYTVWPAQKGYKNSSYVKEYSQQGNYSNQQFAWSRDSVIFSTFNGKMADDKNFVASYSCIQPPTSISSLQMPVHINLWLFDGKPPADGKPVEVLIDSFSFGK